MEPPEASGSRIRDLILFKRTRMNTIHKIAAMVIKDDTFLMVRKTGKDIWTNLGGKPEGNETEEEALVREIKEELNCECKILRKLADFKNKAVFEDAEIHLSTYLVELIGDLKIPEDENELEEFKFISQEDVQGGLKLPPSITEQVLPYCIENNLLGWKI